jgi:hypothetical protein
LESTLFFVVEDLTHNLVISHDIMERSVKLGTALVEHALAVFHMITIEDAQKILKWIRRGHRQTFTLRECFCARTKAASSLWRPTGLAGINTS